MESLSDMGEDNYKFASRTYFIILKLLLLKYFQLFFEQFLRISNIYIDILFIIYAYLMAYPFI